MVFEQATTSISFVFLCFLYRIRSILCDRCVETKTQGLSIKNVYRELNSQMKHYFVPTHEEEEKLMLKRMKYIPINSF